jgi:hypothetical protein
VSSAKSLPVLFNLSHKSFMNITNNSGPSTDPWGTPLKTLFHSDTCSPSTKEMKL